MGTVAAAQESRPDRIKIEYDLPKNPAHQVIYDKLKQNKALEKLQEIFSPFRLPIDITLKTMSCDGVDNAWYQRPNLTICYEYIDVDIMQNVPEETTSKGITPTDATVGPFFYVVGHEMGHAMFDLLGVPLFGRPEDAADQFATYMMLLIGKSEARRLIGGTAHSYHKYMESPKVNVKVTAFADVHSAPAQRFYNLLCLAYGADREMFGDLVERGFLPADRARACRVEFQEVNFAFEKLIFPYLDAERMKQVLAKDWLPPPTPPEISYMNSRKRENQAK